MRISDCNSKQATPKRFNYAYKIERIDRLKQVMSRATLQSAYESR